MNNFEIDSDTKVTLYFTGSCYGCKASEKYDDLHRFVLDHHIKLNNFLPKRIELNPEWQREIESYGVALPAVLIENTKGEKLALPYQEFVKDITKTQEVSRESAEPQLASSDVGAELVESPIAPSNTRKKAKNGKKSQKSESK